MNTTKSARPGVVGRLRSRQSGLPSGLLGRIFGRAMEGATAESNARALGHLDLSQPRTILEVGFGQGRTIADLAGDGHRVLGVDASPTMVKQATTRNRTACREGLVTLRAGDGIGIPFADDTADAAITVHTIYFMDAPAATLTDIARVLRPGGTLVVGCRTSDTATPTWMDPDVYRIRPASQILAMLHAAGFDHLEHHAADSTTHDTHLFVGRLANHLPTP